MSEPVTADLVPLLVELHRERLRDERPACPRQTDHLWVRVKAGE